MIHLSFHLDGDGELYIHRNIKPNKVWTLNKEQITFAWATLTNRVKNGRGYLVPDNNKGNVTYYSTKEYEALDYVDVGKRVVEEGLNPTSLNFFLMDNYELWDELQKSRSMGFDLPPQRFMDLIDRIGDIRKFIPIQDEIGTEKYSHQIYRLANYSLAYFSNATVAGIIGPGDTTKLKSRLQFYLRNREQR